MYEKRGLSIAKLFFPQCPFQKISYCINHSTWTRLSNSKGKLQICQAGASNSMLIFYSAPRGNQNITPRSPVPFIRWTPFRFRRQWFKFHSRVFEPLAVHEKHISKLILQNATSQMRKALNNCPYRQILKGWAIRRQVNRIVSTFSRVCI